MHTREEAKKLICPFLPVSKIGGVGNYMPMTTCIADRCAMWRWLDKSHHKSTGAIVEEVKLGFCGLAGRQPE